MRKLSCIIDKDHDGLPVKEALRDMLKVSAAGIRRAKAINNGITLDNELAFTIHYVHAGQVLSIVISDEDLIPNACTIEPQPGPIDIIYEDEDLVAVNKPADLVVHPGPGHPDQTLSNYLMYYFAQTGKQYNLHPCQRIDLGTTGLLLFATNSYAHDRIQKQLHTNSFSRDYLAICEGELPQEEGVVSEPIDRLSRAPSVFGISKNGKEAITHYKVLATFEIDNPIEDASNSCENSKRIQASTISKKTYSLVQLRLMTGRTHQIRIHMAHLGNPLLGDFTYGNASSLIDHHCLHSWKISVTQPATNKQINICASLPQELAQLLPEEIIKSIENSN